MQSKTDGEAPQFDRLPIPNRRQIYCSIDGVEAAVCQGDTVLTAVLTMRRSLRPFEFADSQRAGFCLMGACQDCWVHLGSGQRVRACSTLVIDGMEIITSLGRRFND
ncbi:(2Fe-2S)-binding protein [Sinorhizobium fredii]|uniref:(2Fe-2S)-binding protein n=1 Tax=Rhizobium fredii TaxID=380 RepID=UPI00055D1416|nr:(2Fe-2S)-binding protein [Sinorhizobium fredii]